MSGSLPCFLHISASRDVGQLRITLLIFLCHSINTLMPSNLMTLDHGFLRARQAANQTASGRPPSITDVTSTDPLPYVAGTPARQGRLRSPWQNCMTLHLPHSLYDRIAP